jgi:hypothetical protein
MSEMSRVRKVLTLAQMDLDFYIGKGKSTKKFFLPELSPSSLTCLLDKNLRNVLDMKRRGFIIIRDRRNG